MNPIATIFMENGAKIVIELLPNVAANAVNSFIYAAKNGFFDNHAIERIVPGNWIDMSYSAFDHEECKYLIPYEYEIDPQMEHPIAHPGCVCMGGYENGLSGCEFFFPLRDCPDHKGTYPVFGKVLEGMEELYRLEKIETTPVTDFPFPIIVNKPVEPQVIKKVTLELFGEEYPEPVRVEGAELPVTWLRKY